MKFKIQKEKLSEILQIADKAISQLVPYPALKGILIKIQKEELIFISSDKHISIKTSLTEKELFEVEEEGSFLIDEKLISEITRKIDSEEINFESVEGDYITIYGGNSNFKLNVLELEKYSEIDFTSVGSKFKVNSNLLKTIIEKTAYACSEKEIHPNLTGINLFSKEGKLHASATDHIRLSHLTLDIDVKEDFNIIIPKKYFINVVQCFKENEDLEIEIESKKIIFTSKNTVIQTELVEDLFPDILPILKRQPISKLVVNKNKLLKTIDRCSLIKDEKNKTAINLILDNHVLSLSTKNNISSLKEEIEIISYDGTNNDVLYDSKYLQDALKVMDTENVSIEFTGELKPIYIKNSDKDDLVAIISPQKK